MLIDGNVIAKKINKKTAKKVLELKKKGIIPKLAVLLIGNNKASETYVGKKQKIAQKLEIDFELFKLPADTNKQKIISHINEIQKDKKLSGLIVQLPLPNKQDTEDVINSIKPEIDVDYLTKINFEKLENNTNKILPPTPGAVMDILEESKVEIAQKNVVILGKGILVGKPLAIIMRNLDANVIVCDSKTKDTKEKTLKADIIVSAVGKKDLIRGDMIKQDAIVIDTGVCFENKKMYGDVNVKEVLKKASYVTPTPGGVGPITVEQLLFNTALCAEKNI